VTGQVRNFLTVDVEEWFHVCGVGGALAPEHWPTLPSRVEFTTTLALELLARRNVRATFFVLGSVGERHPRLVERIVSVGHEVASHGFSHRRVFELDELIEIPPLGGRWFGQQYPLGGGWGLRMSRPSTVIREIEARDHLGVPATLFVHPWELDPEPPRVSLPPALRFSHYFRLSGFARRLDEILSRATFGPIGEWVIAGSAA
jgi:hypothetical protein